MVEWHHQLSGHEFEQTLVYSERLPSTEIQKDVRFTQPKSNQQTSNNNNYTDLTSLVSHITKLKMIYHISIVGNSEINYQFGSLSHVWLFETPWTAAHQVSLSITDSQSLLKLMSIESMMPSNHLILCHPLLLLPSIFPSIRVFSSESALHIRWLKYWSFSSSVYLLTPSS